VEKGDTFRYLERRILEKKGRGKLAALARKIFYAVNRAGKKKIIRYWAILALRNDMVSRKRERRKNRG